MQLLYADTIQLYALIILCTLQLYKSLVSQQISTY